MSTIHIFAFIVIIEPRTTLEWKVMTSPGRWPICLFPFLDYDSSLQRHTTRQAVLSKLFFIGTSNLCLSHWGVIPFPPSVTRRRQRKVQQEFTEILWMKKSIQRSHVEAKVMVTHLCCPQFKLWVSQSEGQATSLLATHNQRRAPHVN